MNIFYRILLYGFPIVLLVFETLIRFASNNDITAPTFYLSLCSASTSLLLPVIIPKDVVRKYNIQVPAGATLRCAQDEYLVTIGWIMLFITLCIWTYCFIVPPSEGALVEHVFDTGKKLHIPNVSNGEFITCTIAYLTSVILTELKEII